MQQNFFEMKVPVRPAPARPAPAPPPSSHNGQVQHGSNLFVWDDCNDPFFSSGFGAKPQTSNNHLAVPKKKPPPRPPPPKLPQPKRNKQAPSRSASLLSGLFFRRNSSQPPAPRPPSIQDHSRHGMHPQNSLGLSLIDLHSPSSSPTPTSRSSSDCYSVRSFGSDNGHPLTSGNSSQFESGFEDDFDSFATSSKSARTPTTSATDPWFISQPRDPFSPPRHVTAPQPKLLSGSLFLDSDDFSAQIYAPPTSASTVIKPPTISMPTIIRPKPQKSPMMSKVLEQKDKEKRSYVKDTSPSRLSGISTDIIDEDDDSCDEGNWSPPMPSIPPPPAPVLNDVEDEEPPYLPPRPVGLQDVKLEMPHGIALYDFNTSHPDDLSFKVNDAITLLRQVNPEWYYGCLGGREGMFPANFIEVRVPLTSQDSSNVVKTLYTFTLEAAGDLGFQEGALIKVLGKINDDWLYGEHGGRRGQFPAAFVDRTPANLPVHSL